MQETVSSSSTTQEKIKMYATTWCGDCRMAKRWFDSHDIPYEYINIEQDDEAAAYVVRVTVAQEVCQRLFSPMVLSS